MKARINEKLYCWLQLQLIQNSSIHVHQVNPSTETLGCFSVSLTFGSITRDVWVHVFENMKAELLLGLDTMALFSLSVDLTSMTLLRCSEKAFMETIGAVTTNTLQSKCEHVDESGIQCLKALLEKHASICSGSQAGIGAIALEQHAISVTNHVPVCNAPYRTSSASKAEIERQVESLRQKRFSRPSLSPYASPMVLESKKDDGRTRFCVDYRKLNAITVPNHHLIRRIDDLIDAVGSSNYFTTLDVT